MTALLTRSTDAASVLDDAMIAAIAAHADETERLRRLPPPLLDRLIDTGAFSLLTPSRLGGREADPITLLEVVEAAASVDGSVGWLLLGNVGGLCTAFLPPHAAAEVLADGPLVIGGTLVPRGEATVVDGGFVVSGRWSFASGVDHCRWMMLGCGDPAGMRAMFVPTERLTVIDTWSVTGLRGTGSHDIVAHRVFVPAQRSFVVGGAAQDDGPLYRFPLRSLGAAGIATVCLGIARGAVDAFAALATTKLPTGSTATVATRATAQIQFAEAEALVGSARAWLFDLIDAAWSQTIDGDEVTPRQQALIRLAAANACASAARAVDLIHAASGGTAIMTSSPIERAFRDVHTATQHFSVQASVVETVGRFLLDQPPLPGPPL